MNVMRQRLEMDDPRVVPPGSTQLSPEEEQTFQEWYRAQSSATGMHPDPSAFLHRYDNRLAYQSGAQPGVDGHWPSQYKLSGHPNRFIAEQDGLLDSITGQYLGGVRQRPMGR